MPERDSARERALFEATLRSLAASRILGSWPDELAAVEASVRLVLQARRWLHEAARAA